MICISLPGPSLEDLQQQLKSASSVADLIEFRLDLYDHPSIIRQVQEQCTLPFILTLRPKAHGGAFVGTEEERLKILHSLLDLNPEYVDLENFVPMDRIRDWPSETKIIRSHHDFSGTPKDLKGLLNDLTKNPAAIYKIATTAESTLDALNLLHLAKTSTEPLTVMAMGEKGSCSRILGPVVGCPFVYAALSEDLCTAPEQISAHELREVYNYSNLNPSTALYALLGDPIHQSVGHLFHNAYMRDHNALYTKLHVTADELETTLSLAVELGFQGFSVTIPHKEKILPLLDEVDTNAQKIGAVNTVTVKEGKLYGSNTDAGGALDALEHVAPVSGQKMVLLGAGGANRAVAFEAKRRGADLVILNRDTSRAERLAKELSCEWGSLSDFPEIPYTILVNGTPNQMPIDSKDIKKGTTVMDLSITPKETELLKAAKALDCKI
ncbi:MAG: Shikimate dehydrogenase (NADP(+)), partial [Chlamydiae bacterium]|nr:Shikimate dehydrogenase (NADP(+)) [Chlamydiota bacterium]